jgi:hypothetical protein
VAAPHALRPLRRNIFVLSACPQLQRIQQPRHMPRPRTRPITTAQHGMLYDAFCGGLCSAECSGRARCHLTHCAFKVATAWQRPGNGLEGSFCLCRVRRRSACSADRGAGYAVAAPQRGDAHRCAIRHRPSICSCCPPLSRRRCDLRARRRPIGRATTCPAPSPVLASQRATTLRRLRSALRLVPAKDGSVRGVGV